PPGPHRAAATSGPAAVPPDRARPRRGCAVPRNVRSSLRPPPPARPEQAIKILRRHALPELAILLESRDSSAHGVQVLGRHKPHARPARRVLRQIPYWAVFFTSGTVTGGLAALPIHGDQTPPQHLLRRVCKIMDPSRPLGHYCNAYHNTDRMSRRADENPCELPSSLDPGFERPEPIGRFLHPKVAIYNHALVNPQDNGNAKTQKDLRHLPTYIQPKQFADALMDIANITQDSPDKIKAT